jgi:hypothetical protein
MSASIKINIFFIFLSFISYLCCRYLFSPKSETVIPSQAFSNPSKSPTENRFAPAWEQRPT